MHKNFICLAITNPKYKDYNSFYNFLLLLSGDLSLNPGPVQVSLAVNIKGALLGLRQFLATESPLKVMKNAFCFTFKALFVLKIFKFLS